MKLIQLILLFILAGCAGGGSEGEGEKGVISQISDNATFVVANELEAQLIAANFDSIFATAVKNGAIEASSQEPNDLLYVIPAAFEGAYDVITNAGLDEEQQAKAFDVIIESLLANAVGMDSTDSGALTARIGTVSDQVQITSDADGQFSVTTSNKNLRILGTAEDYSGVRGVLLADIYGVSDLDTSKAVSYQWLSDGNAISGATGKTLDMGDFFSSVQYKDITVRLTYTNTSGQQTSITSAVMPYEGFRIVANAEDGRNEWSGETASVEVNNSVNPYPLKESYSKNGTSSTSGTSAGSAHNITAVRAVDEGITAREGENVIRIYADGSKSNRSELAHLNNETTFKSGEDYYFSGSFYASRKEWDPIVAGGSTVITQLKQYGGGDPNFELRLSNNGDYKMTWRAVPHDLSNYQEMGYAIPDAWNDVKIYAKHSQGSDGIFQVWLNSEKVIDYSGATMYRSAEGYLKFGMYTEIYDERVIYWDAIDISDHLTKDFNTWLNSGDNLPSITINGISDNQQFAKSNIIVVSGTANDPSGDQLGSAGGIQSVELFAGNTRLQSTTEASFSFSGLNLSDGQHTLRVVATDTDGNEAEETVTIWIGNRAPQVSIDSSTYLLGSFNTQSSINLSTTASDPDGSIVKVEFLANGQLIGTASQGSSDQYTLSWKPTTAGAYSIQARATDNQGAITLSDSKVALFDSSITSTTLSAIQDVTIFQNSTRTGNWSETEIYGSESSPKIALVEFNLSDISSAKYIQSASFRPYVIKLQNSPGTFSIYAVGTESWSQTSVNWYSKPSKGKLIDTITIGATGSYANFDVTEALQIAVDAGQSKVTLWIEDSEQEQQRFDFASENNGSYNKPAQLIVESATTALPDPVEGSNQLNTTPDTSAPTFVSAANSSVRILGSAEYPSRMVYGHRAQDTGGRIKVDLTSLEALDPNGGISYQWFTDGVEIPGATSQELITTDYTDYTDEADLHVQINYTKLDGSSETVKSPLFNYYDWRTQTGAEENTLIGDNPTPFWETYSYNKDSSNHGKNGDLFTDSEIHSIEPVLASVAGIEPGNGAYVIKIRADGREYGSRKLQSYSKRSELGSRDWNTRIREDSEVFYSASIYFPSEYWDQKTKYSTIIMQHKQYVGGQPNFSIRMSNTGDYKLFVQSKYHLAKKKHNSYHIATLKPDHWHDLRVHLKPGDKRSGFLNIYLDGERIFEYEGKTLKKSPDDSFLKIGMYTQIRDERVIYFDNVEMSNKIHESVESWVTTAQRLDADSGSDGFVDASDAFPNDPPEWIDTDGDGIGNNADSDDDSDGYADLVDNCPLVDNPDQLDTDNDLQGDVCDSDDDGDSVLDYADAFPLDPDKSEDRGLSTMLGNLTTAVATKGLDSPAMLQTLTESLVRNLPTLGVSPEEIEQTYSETIVQATTSVVMENETENLDSLLEALGIGVVQGAKQISTVNVDIASIAQVTSETLTTTAAEEDPEYVVSEKAITDLVNVAKENKESLASQGALQILGTAEDYSGVRGVLRADIDDISDLDQSKTLSYQWFANGEAIGGATNQRLDVGDFKISIENKDITVQLTYTNTSGQQTTITSPKIPWGGFRVTATAEDGRNEWAEEDTDEAVDNSVNPYPLKESYSKNGTSSTSGTSAGAAHNITSVRATDVGITAREGENIIRIYADGSESNRAELYHQNETKFKEGEDFYFSGSFYAPKEEWDPVTDSTTIITQLKQYGGGRPNFALKLSNEGDYKMYWIGYEHGITDNQEIGYAIPDAWNDLKIYTKHSQGSDGVFQVWLNDKKVVDYSGATMYKDAEGYIKFGMYMNIFDERILYWDAIDIADHLANDFDTWLDSGDNGVSPLDTTAPIYFSTATSIDGTKVILSYNETLSATTAAASDFIVNVDGSAVSISGVATSGSTVELTLTTAIPSDQTVTVDYTDPSSGDDTNAIQDAAGNDAASLSGTTFTSNSTAGTSATTKLFATQDASIKENSSTNGNWSKNEVYGGSTPVIALVEFDLSSFSQGDGIQSATFRPYVRTLKNDQSSTFSIYSTTSKEWSQSSVQWSTRPLKDQLLDNVTISASGSYVDFDVTSVIQAAINSGQSKVTLWIEDSEEEYEGFEFDSVNNNTSYPNEPELVVVTGEPDGDADTTSPTFSYAVASFDGTQVFFVYDEVLSSTTAETSAFTVNIEETEANISSVETSGSTVALTLTSVITSGQSITVAYKDPSSSDDANAIQDSVGNDAESLSSTSVTNLSVAVDSDGDGVYDTWDNCPIDPNTNQFDTDGDDQGDVCDADDDADGVLDTLDNCPLEANTDQLDTDSDGRGDTCDFDDDGDWVLDQLDNCPLDVNSNQLDGDGDGQGDVCDTDLDNDNIANDVDNCPLEANTDQLDSDGDGQGNVCDSDDDGDTIVDSLDNCPLNANASQLDSDGDGIGNVCDSDNDNDGVADSSDAFPSDPNEWVDTDSDGIGNNADSDDDGDGVADSSDAFPLDSSESVDTDGDGIGNNADSDDDGDGVADSSDAFPLDSSETIDSDSDGIGNNADSDDDGDGVADSSDAFPLDSSESVDTDGDGIGNNADSDDDNDGVADSSDAFPLDSSESVDTDSDGIGDNSDNCRTNANADQADADGNGTGDVCETTTEKTINANRDNSVHSRSDEVGVRHNWDRVEILSKGTYTVAGLFGFNLSDNITSSQTVDNATLRLTIDEINNANSSNDYHVYGTNDDWNDNVTWNSYFSKKPNTGYSFSSLDNKSITSTTAYEFDVTSYVQTVHTAANTGISFWVEDLDNSSQTIEVQTDSNGGMRAQLILSVR